MQFQNQMGSTDASDSEFATSVAAAAYAITKVEEEMLNRKNLAKSSRGSFTKLKSKKEENIIKPTDSSKISRWFSGKDAKDGRAVESTNNRIADERPTRKPSRKEDSTIESSKHKKPGPNAPSLAKPFSSGKLKGNKMETRVDAWEKTQMAKIQKRHEKISSSILEWENEKKKVIDKRRARALREYQDDMSRIDKIAGGARTLADEKRRDDEAKVIEKAKQIKSTGKVPHTCFGFSRS